MQINPSSSKNTFFESIYNNSIENAMLIMQPDGKISSINKAFTSCFGYLPADIIGKSTTILFTKEDIARGLPLQELKNVTTTGQSSDNNYLVAKNKQVTWVSGESILYQDNNGVDQIIKIIQDINEQKQAENSLKSLHKLNENILGTIKDVVLVLDGNMNIIKANQAFTDLFEYQRTATLPLNFASFIAEYDKLEEVRNNIESVIKGKPGFWDHAIETKVCSGETRVFSISSTLLQNDDELQALVFMHDITLYKQLEKGREDLIGFVAHELRNPLANLMLCNDLMGEFLNNNMIRESAGILQRSKNNVLRLNKMIGELYNGTKLDSGNINLEVSVFNLKNMIDEAIETTTSLQPAYKIVLTGKANIKVKGDKYRLMEVVNNYLSNGIKYSNGNTNVTMHVSHSSTEVTIAVKDEGLGIPKDQLPYIFERYFRAEKTRNLEGLGLGLYLCRRIINAHNGKVWAESEEGKGSVFYFSLPLNI